jgi:hypothetical protein
MSVCKELLEALKLFRSLVDETPGGVPRYNVNPGAALNAVIEEIVDPAIRRGDGYVQIHTE